MIRRKHTTFVASFALCTLLIAACNGSSTPAQHTDDGYAALGKSDWKGAQSDFDQALASLKSTDAGFLRAKMGQIEALTHTDSTKAKEEFLAIAAGMSSQLTSKEYVNVASNLAGERKFMDAIAVLKAGTNTYPEDVKLRAVGNRMATEANKAGDSEAQKALKGLGYLGD